MIFRKDISPEDREFARQQARNALRCFAASMLVAAAAGALNGVMTMAIWFVAAAVVALIVSFKWLPK